MADKPSEVPKGTADAAGTGDPQQDPSQNSGEGDLSALKLDAQQQAHFETVLEKRLERARETWEKKSQEDAEKARKAAEEARLAEAQEFQQLAQRRQQTIEEQAQELATAQAKAELTDKYRKALEAYRDQMIEGVPDHITALLKPMDVVDQMAWLTANADQLKPAEDGTPGRYIGPPPAPGGKGSNGQLAPEEKRKRAWKPQL